MNNKPPGENKNDGGKTKQNMGEQDTPLSVCVRRKWHCRFLDFFIHLRGFKWMDYNTSSCRFPFTFR